MFAVSTKSAMQLITSGKTKYGGMEAADIRRLREPEDENRRLKQMSAELLLENK
jgi:hypothetical protein